MFQFDLDENAWTPKQQWKMVGLGAMVSDGKQGGIVKNDGPIGGIGVDVNEKDNFRSKRGS